MKIKQNKVKKILEKATKDLELALLQYGYHDGHTGSYIKQAKARITSLIDIIDWDDDNDTE